MSTYRFSLDTANKPRREKTDLRGFRPGPTQSNLYSHRKLEAGILDIRKLKRNCTILVAKTIALINHFTADLRLFSHK